MPGSSRRWITPRALSAGCWAGDLACTGPVALDFLGLKHDIPPQHLPPLIPVDFKKAVYDRSRPEEGSTEALAKEAAELRDKVLRTLAEMENLRKRTTREVTDARVYAISGFARDVLDIADNLQRALDAVPAEAKAAADPGLKALIEGVELTERSLLNTLEKN